MSQVELSYITLHMPSGMEHPGRSSLKVSINPDTIFDRLIILDPASQSRGYTSGKGIVEKPCVFQCMNSDHS